MGGWSHVRNSPSLRIMKIIHGRGSKGGSAMTKDLVRNWAFRHRDTFRMGIEGEHYSVHEPGTQQLRREVGQYPDEDLDNENPGITLLWVK